MAKTASVIENQIFIGVPWKVIRPKFEEALASLQEDYPLHWVIFGRNTTHDAQDLWNSIKAEIDRSASTIFDLTGSNPNVALEFGYAEALGKRRVLTRYEARKPGPKRSGSQRTSSSAGVDSIMSDLTGKIRKPYKSVISIKKALTEEFDRNPYVVRYKQTAKSKPGVSKRSALQSL